MTINPANSTAAHIAFLVKDSHRDKNQLSALAAALDGVPAWPISAIGELIEQLMAVDIVSGGPLIAAESIGQALTRRFQAPEQDARARGGEVDLLRKSLVSWYHRLPVDSSARNHVLGVLAAGGSRQALSDFAELLVSDPAQHAGSLGIAMAPLIGLPQPELPTLFPRLLDGMQHPGWGAAILDLANHTFGTGRLADHPAGPRAPALSRLLASLVAKLTDLERSTEPPNESARRAVADSIPLVVSLCHALGQLKSVEAGDALRAALRLQHRRIRAEAAAALAGHGDPAGAAALIELAQYPVVRLRALAYAAECGVLDQIESRYQTPAARAEAELAAWLAEPAQFGVPPLDLHWLDQRELYWPGYEEPRTCYLFRFQYPTAQGTWTNVGIVGPMTHASSASLAGLSIADSYALFAGWQADHEDIYEIEPKHWPERTRAEVAARQADLNEHGFEAIEPAFVGRFLGNEFVVARARRGGVFGHLVFDSFDSWWLADEAAALTSELAYCVFKGRKLLAQFNPDFPA
jgi:hypothetical protein